jgi:putative DNA primase/helicase
VRWVHGVKGTYAEIKIPYRLPKLLAAPPTEPVWIPEGEKDADNVAALDLIATTNPGGAKQFQPELVQWFKGNSLPIFSKTTTTPAAGIPPKFSRR